MANYFIIGGDDKEYGPITDADVRLWIAEGRLNGESRAKAEGDAEFRALAQFTEFAAALNAQAAPAPSAPTRSSTDFLERDYELDIGGCISRGWELLKENFGLIFASFLIMILVQMACGGALNLISLAFGKSLLQAPIAVRLGYNYFFTGALSVVMGPLMGGLFLVYLKTIRRQPTGVGEVFAGFQQAFLQLFLGALVVSLITNACMLPFQYVWQKNAGPLLEKMQHLQNDPAGMQNLLPQLMPAFTSAIPVLLVCLVPVIFFTVCFQFALPLIIDKQMDFGTALKTSWKMVNKHWWQVFGLTVLVGLVSAAGVLACCIGVLFTAPIGVAALMFAYETIFGAEKISHAKARNAALLNQLATPGLGSLIAGRWLAGSGQLLIFLAGFVIYCAWSINNLKQYYSLMYSDMPVENVGWNRTAWAAVALCAAGWLWSLVTSISLMREASQSDVASLKLFAAGGVKLEAAGIISALATLPQWQRCGEIISRTFEFKDFPAAMRFVNAVAELAEQAQHHPDIDVRWNKVTLALTTHDAGGLTEKDFALARHCDALSLR